MRHWILIAMIGLLLTGCRRSRRRAPEPAPLPAASAPVQPVSAPGARSIEAYAQPSNAPSQPASASNPAAWIEAHNRARARHCAPPLAWSPKLAQAAQKWANTLRDKGCAFGHSGGNYGENLAAGTIGTLDAESIVKMWYDEIAHYKFPDGGFSPQTGHFTQVVWRGTSQLGCARSLCKTMEIWVCEYERPGNWEGQYRSNVLPLGCKP